MRMLRAAMLWTATVGLSALAVAGGLALVIRPVNVAAWLPADAPAWLWQGAGVAALIGGIGLLVPRLAWRGALGLGILLIAAIGLALWQGEETAAMVSAGVLAVLTAVGYARHPRATLVSRLRHATDLYAEKQMIEHRRYQRAVALRRRSRQVERLNPVGR